MLMHNRKKKGKIPSLAPAVHIYIHLANTWKNFYLIHSWMSGGEKWIPDRFILRYCYNSWQSQPSWWHIVSVVLCLSCTMSLWDGKDKDMGFRNCFFQDDLCEGLPLSPWYMVHIRWRHRRMQLFYKWENVMLAVEPGATGTLFF